jgi:PAS domain S-box-containing protein
MNSDSSIPDSFNPVDCSSEQLLRDLQLRQIDLEFKLIELEVQNENLRSIQIQYEESNSYYADLFNNAPVGYLTLTKKGHIVDVNLIAAKLFDIEYHDLLSRRFASFIAPDDGDRWYLMFAELIKHNQTVDIELALKNSQGKALPVQLNCLSNNATVRISITNIRQANTVLHDAEATVAIDSSQLLHLKNQKDLLYRLQKITSLVPGMFYKFCLRPDGSAHFPFASEGIRELFQLSPDDIRDDASQLFALIHPDDFDGVVASIQKAVQDLAPWSHEYRVKFDDGAVRWVYGRSLPEQEEDGSNLWYWYGFMSDITEHKQMEAEREEALNRFQKITSQVPGMVFQFHLRTDGSSCFPYASEAIRNIYRLSPEDVRKDASKVFALIHPNDLDVHIVIMQKSAQELLPFSHEYRVQYDDGTVRWLMGNSVPQRKADSSTFFYGFITDITERKQLEENFKKSRYQLELFIQQAPVSIAMFDLNMNHLAISDRWFMAFGGGFESLIGRNHYEVNPDLPAKWKLIHQQGLAGEFLKNEDDFWVQKDGSKDWLSWTVSPWFNDKGLIGGIIIFSENITQRKQIEHALRESEFLWKFAIEGTGDGVWDRNVLTNEIYYSKHWKEMLGYTENDILPTRQEWLERIHPDDQLPVAEVLQAYLDGKTEIYVVEYRLRCKDDSYKWILARGLVVDYTEEGTPLRMIGTHTDISKRKYQEQQDKEHLNQLAHVTRLGLMGEMASGIAHEVNQPLTAIATYTQASLNLMKAECPNLDKLAEIVYKTQQQALRAGQIIRRMREFVKSNTRQVSEVDLNELIQNAVSLCLPDLKLGNIVLSLELQDSLPFVNVDTLQIEQVIINLIRNSADALGSDFENQQKKISIDTLLTLNEGIEVRVKDNGPGITEDQQQHILMPFYTTKTEGMGMGLSICGSIIEAHQGYLKFNSKVGKGTTFYFTLPLTSSPT